MFNALNVSKEWNIPQKHHMMHVSIVVILTMASPSALSQFKQELTRLRWTSPGMEVVKGDEVAVQMVAVDRVVAVVMAINPTPMASGGIPPIFQDSTIHAPKILMHYPFLVPTYSGLSLERNLPLEVVEAQLPLPCCSVSYYWKHWICYQFAQRSRWAAHCSVQDKVREWAIHLFSRQL